MAKGLISFFQYSNTPTLQPVPDRFLQELLTCIIHLDIAK